MAKLDDIFKSDLSEEKKKSKKIFGRLLLKLKKENYIKLYSLMGGASDTDLVDGVLNVILSDKTAYDMSNNKNDIDTLTQLSKGIDDSVVSVKLVYDGTKVFDMYQFEQYLKEEFGRILTIK